MSLISLLLGCSVHSLRFSWVQFGSVLYGFWFSTVLLPAACLLWELKLQSRRAGRRVSWQSAPLAQFHHNLGQLHALVQLNMHVCVRVCCVCVCVCAVHVAVCACRSLSFCNSLSVAQLSGLRMPYKAHGSHGSHVCGLFLSHCVFVVCFLN